MMSEQIDQSPVTTAAVAIPIDYVADGYIIMEAKQLWSDLRYRIGTDDRRANMSFASNGIVLVAIPTRENPPEPPKDLDGLKVITLDEYLFAVMQVMQATESIRNKIGKQLNDQNTF